MAERDFALRNEDHRVDLPARRRPVRVQSVGRACQLLLLVASGETDCSGKELAARSGLAGPTAHHLLGTLVAEGLLARGPNARYVLGPRVAVLADAYQRGLSAPEYLLGPLQRLADTTGETTYLAGWRNGNIHTFAVAEGNLPVRVSVPAGGPYRDAHARAGGKVLLAYAPEGMRERYQQANPLRPITPHTIADSDQFEAELNRIRVQGYATDEEEFLAGVSCISVPILHANVLVAVYSMSIPAHRFSERRNELRRALVATAQSIQDAVAANSRASDAAIGAT